MHQIQVQYMNHMGNDDSIVNAARVSFDRDSSQFTPEENAKLIRYLGSHKHEIPFAHTAITLRVKAPISIRTQCFKHKVGFVENEVSRRYVRSTPYVYVPVFRSKPDKSIKQGSGDVIDDVYYVVISKLSGNVTLTADTQEDLQVKLDDWVKEYTKENPEDVQGVTWFVSDIQYTNQADLQFDYEFITSNLVDEYERLVSIGVAPEQARFILPQGAMTEWVWTGSLLAFARFVNLRNTPYAQEEVRQVANLVSEVIQPLYPESWKALTGSSDVTSCNT